MQDDQTRRDVPQHWADRAAEEIEALGEDHVVVATGISPSGTFHVGHTREILTGDAVTRALLDRGVSAELVFIVDNLDPLRKVYPFLDQDVYQPCIGRSLSKIPAPNGEGTYDEYYLAPFLAAIQRLRVDARVIRASELYASGRMDDVVFDALEGRDGIAEIMKKHTGRELPEDWSPWNPESPETGRLTETVVLGWNREAGTIRFRDQSTGHEHETAPSAGGKLTWRVDWPARWKALGVVAEPFGKDHSSRGGSYDTGKEIAREVFGYRAPYPIIYEWIALKGGGDMSASKGNVLALDEALTEVAPPEALRYFVVKARPTRRLTFDPGVGLLALVDEVDDESARGRDSRAMELSQAAGFKPVGVSFKHLVTVGQIAGFDLDRVMTLLREGGYERADREAVKERLAMARRWLDRFAPESEKIEVPKTVPESAKALDGSQKAFLADLADALVGLSDAAAIHECIYQKARAEGGPGPKAAFQAIYQALLGRDRGPRAGAFIALLGSEMVAERFRHAAALEQ